MGLAPNPTVVITMELETVRACKRLQSHGSASF